MVSRDDSYFKHEAVSRAIAGPEPNGKRDLDELEQVRVCHKQQTTTLFDSEYV